MQIIHVMFALQCIEDYRKLAVEILNLPSVAHYDMIRLDCEDLMRALVVAAKGMADTLLEKVADDHRKENKK